MRWAASGSSGPSATRSWPRALGWAMLLSVVTAAGASAESPGNQYMIHCQGCHLPDGSGKPGAVPALSESIGRFASLPEGRAFLVRVPGVAMSPLDHAQTAAVLNWMLERFAAGDLAGDFEPFTAREVEELGRTRMLEVRKMRRALIRRLERD